MPRDYPSSRPRGYSSVSRSRSRSMSSQPSHHRSRGKHRNNSPYQRSFRNDSYVDKDDGVRVHVSDLSVDCSKRELEEAFGKFGGYKEVWVARNPPCFAFIVYNHRQDAEEAIRKMDNTYISGSRIRVSFARPRTRGTRRGTVFDPNMRCYTCGERGHFSRECPKMNRGYNTSFRSSPHRSSHRGGRKRSRSPASRSRSRSAASSQTYSDRSSPDRRRRPPSKNHRTKDSSSRRHHHNKQTENVDGGSAGHNRDDRNGRRKKGRLSKSSSEEPARKESPLATATAGEDVKTSPPKEASELQQEGGSSQHEMARGGSNGVEERPEGETLEKNGDFDGDTATSFTVESTAQEVSEEVSEKVEGDLYGGEVINEDLNQETVITESESYSTISKEVTVTNEHNDSPTNSPNENQNIFEVEESFAQEEISISIKQDERESLDD